MPETINNLFTPEGGLTVEEVVDIAQLNGIMGYLRDNYAEDLAYALGDTVTNVDVSTESSKNLTAYFVQALQAAAPTDADGFVNDDDLYAATEEFNSYIPNDAKTGAFDQVLSAYNEAYGTMNPNFSGSQPQGRFLQSSGGGVAQRSCDEADCPIHIYNPFSSCYAWCTDEQGAGGTWEATYGCPPETPNCAEPDAPSGFTQALGTITTTLGNIAGEIGWDNIWGSIVGTDGDGGDSTTYYINQEGEDKSGEGFNWGKLAIGVLITAVVVGGIVYFVTRKKD